MASKHSYTMTLKNNETEREGINFLLEQDKTFINPDSKTRKEILEMFETDKRYYRAFDLIKIKKRTEGTESIEISKENILLIELKTTQKELKNNPNGFFFGATESEFELATKLEENYRFCFVSLHKNTKSYKLVSLKELNSIIKRKRIQYQINL